jgi:hypothetical protein
MRKNTTILTTTTTTLGVTTLAVIAIAVITIALSLVELVVAVSSAAEDEDEDANVNNAEDIVAVNAITIDIAKPDDSATRRHTHEGNSTLSATFSIRVTPEHYHLISWSILWCVFFCSVLFGLYQMHLERKWLKWVQSSNNSNKLSSRNNNNNSNSKSLDPESGIVGLSGGRTSTFSKSGRLIRASSRPGSSTGGRMSLSKSSASINSSSNPGNLGDEQAVSSGDISRATFRRLLLFAMISRTIAIPIQIYSDPLWIQLIADTFPVMAYATAWMWLVSFFVRLVGVALGTNPNPNPNNIEGGGGIGGIGGGISLTKNSSSGGGSSGSGGNSANSNNNSNAVYKSVATIDTVIQITAYTVYALLIITFTVFRRIAAAVLLYALLCCVYATLLGTGLYFCPRLLGLLLPGLGSSGSGSSGESPSSITKSQYYKNPLAIRLGLCTIICLLVFAARTFCFARKVVQSTGGAPDSTGMQHSSSSGSSGSGGGGPYWWFQYGTLEWLPSILFLIMLHPKKVISSNDTKSRSNSNSNNHNNNSDDQQQQQQQQPSASGRRTPPLHSYLKRSDSANKNNNNNKSSSPSATTSSSLLSAIIIPPAETSPLLATHITSLSASSSVNRYGGVGGSGDNNHKNEYQHQPRQGSDRSASTAGSQS